VSANTGVAKVEKINGIEMALLGGGEIKEGGKKRKESKGELPLKSEKV